MDVLNHSIAMELKVVLLAYTSLREKNPVVAEDRYFGQRVYTEGTVVSVDKDSSNELEPFTVIVNIPKITMNNCDTCLFVCCGFDGTKKDKNRIYDVRKGMNVWISGYFYGDDKVAGWSSIRKVELRNCTVDKIIEDSDKEE